MARKSIITVDHPPYSINLASYDYFLDVKIKITIMQSRVTNITKIKTVMTAVDVESISVLIKRL